MLEALFGQAKTLFGKTFLVAGILPASIFVFGMKWHASGSHDGVALLIAESLAEPGKLPAEAILAVIELLAIALILFASRSFVFDFVEHLPGLPFTPLRKHLLARQRRAHRKARELRDKNEVVFNAAIWHEQKFDKLEVEIADAGKLDITGILRESATARGLFTKGTELLEKDRAYELQSKNVEQVVGSLYSLYLLVHKKPLDNEPENEDLNKRLASEISKWKNVAANKLSIPYFELLVTFARQQWTESILDSGNYPESDLWIRPTTLGNRLSALDDYAQSRYGITTGTLWPRLSRILTAEERSEISDKQLLIEADLNLSLVFFAMFVAVVISSSINSWRPIWEFGLNAKIVWLSVFFAFASVLLSYIAYRGALFALGSFSESVKSLVDLRCLQLLPALGYLPPYTVKGSFEIFRELDSFFVSSSERLNRRLAPGPSESDKKKDANPEAP